MAITAKRHTLTNALLAAADEYEKISARIADSDGPNAGIDSLSHQFARQAEEDRALADEIEQGDAITLED